MTFCEYIERISGEPISDFQKKWLDTMEGYARVGCEISMPPNMGRTLWERMCEECRLLGGN